MIYKRILRLALPNIITNITVPLLTLVDLALAGRMGAASTIGAVSVAVGVVNFVVWLFAFLRMGSTGFTAQAYGRSDVRDICLQLTRGLFFASVGGLIIILCRPLLYDLSGLISAGQNVVGDQAKRYLSIAFLAAPASLALYVLNGWFIGMQNTKVVMLVAIVQNVVNIILSLVFVIYVHLDVRGLALGTLIAQYSSVVFLLLAALLKYKRVLAFVRWRDIISSKGINRYFRISIDLIIRTGLLSTVTLYFTYAGTRIGVNAVAANALLMQLFTIFSYFLDGFAYAGEALTGRYIGEQRYDKMKQTIHANFVIGWILALFTMVVYYLYPQGLLSTLTTEQEVVSYALDYAHWAALIPLCGFGAFLWDGIFVGATHSGAMRGSMIAGVVAFFAIYLGWGTYQPKAIYSLDLLWIAFLGYLLIRSLYCWFLGSKIINKKVSAK